jgi:hypothetical protein
VTSLPSLSLPTSALRLVLPRLQPFVFHTCCYTVDTFPLTVKVAPQSSRPKTRGSPIYSWPMSKSKHEQLQPTASGRPLATRACCCWEGTLLYTCIGSLRLLFARVRFSLSPFALLSTPPYFTSDLLSSSVAAPPSPPFSTHAPSRTSLPFSKIFKISVTAVHRYNAAWSVAYGVISMFVPLLSPPLAHFAPRILVLYYLSPTYKIPAPDLVKGRHMLPIPPSCFTLCGSTRPVRRRAEPAALSLVFLVR